MSFAWIKQQIKSKLYQLNKIGNKGERIESGAVYHCMVYGALTVVI